MSDNHDRRDTRRKIIPAVVTGIVAGSVRALATWLLDHFTSHG